jgi:D-erythronate 2-dehydrogenase
LKIVVTGANGFIGKHLVERLCRLDGLGENRPKLTSLTLVSRKFQDPFDDRRIRFVKGDIAESGTLKQAIEGGVDCVFHIASITSGAAERDFEAGWKINVQGTQLLFELLRAQPRPPVVVVSSSIGIYGRPLPRRIDDDTQPLPTLSYGAQKLICEILVADYSRRGFFDGRALRLPGVVARPRNDGGAFSLFLSEIFHAFAADEPEFICPVSAGATPWIMSVECCIDSLLHAARIPEGALSARRAWTIPTLRVRMEDLARTLTEATGSSTRMIYRPAEPFESGIGQLPELATPLAESLGFKHDGTLRVLVDRVLQKIRTAAPQSH